MASPENSGQRRFESGRAVLAVVRLLPRISRPRTALFAATTVLTAALPLAMTIATGLLIGAVPAAADAGPGSPEARDAYLLLAAGVAALLAGRLVANLHNAVAYNLGRDLELLLQDRLLAAVARPVGIAHLEDDEVLALLRIARQLGADFIRPERAIRGLAAIAPEFLSATGASIVLCLFNPWIGLAWLAAWPAIFIAMQADYTRVGRTSYMRSTEMRETEYLRDLAITAAPAKEIRVWGLMGWLLDRYDRQWNERMAYAGRHQRLRPATAVGVIGTLLVLTAATALALADAGLTGTVGFAALAVYLVALTTMFSFSAFDDTAAFLSLGALPVPKVLALEDRLTEGERTVTAELPAAAPEHAIRFEAVDFAYPGSDRPVIAGLDLEIEAGTSLAIVGHNGAGKTSLVKLLAGLYEPTAGRITVDGTDLAGVDPAAWRTRLSALFQDYTRYQLTVRDNIAFGAPHLAGDTDRIWKACEPMGIRALIESLPDGLDTVLSSEYDGGTDLSGGQWQRIALARALFAVQAGAKVLILDEPAAALDVRAEAELYEQFLDITAGLTTIVISHRFSTVRRADRIVVLDGGRVVEDGPHDGLMALGGRYAEAFTLQANRLARTLPTQEQP
ncbi:ABC transporter ATP-binding protein [Glycomyces albidus]|uniref:ATP-binding cassette domain-containing protein n=1 Tax=Glycomyces albidus TaxID=2656774 RepID=A0A6L5GE39_9ACTN|nr:ATP-binding cassette domain-containing protein [Glycomyces albidus]MQM27950.1 ATP-binding cassette domain-containing protein [Glycomyces albidus]